MARAAATRNLPEPYVEFLTRRPVLLVGAIPFDRLLRQLLDAEWGLFDDTRHTVFARSSAINSAPDRSTAKPTGLPRTSLLASRKPVTTSCAGPLGFPPLNGTNTTL